MKELFESPTYRWQKYDVVTTYYWNKYQVKVSYGYPLITEEVSSIPEYPGQWMSGADYRCALCHSLCKTLIIDSDTGKISLSGNVTLAYNSEGTNPWGYSNQYNGTCYLPSNNNDNTCYKGTKCINNAYISPRGTCQLILYDKVKVTGATKTENAGDYITRVSSTNKSAYPSRGKHTDNYYYIKQSKEDHVKGNSLLGTVTSKIETTYPENGYSGGYWYVRTA